MAAESVSESEKKFCGSESEKKVFGSTTLPESNTGTQIIKLGASFGIRNIY
jgi:hypothetical protein